MDEKSKHLDTLNEIKSMMEKSSRFISLSGLSGVFAGIFALIGAFAAHLFLTNEIQNTHSNEYLYTSTGAINTDFVLFFICDSIIVLFLSLVFGYYFTFQNAKKKNLKTWDKTSKQLVYSLLPSLFAGGFFALVLVQYEVFGLIAPTLLIFYGLSLVNASKFTLNDIKYLGFTEIALGLINTQFIGYGLYFWAIGFGVLHIVYGIVMYFKYER